MAELESADILWNLHLDTLKPTCVGLDFSTHDTGLAGRDELLL